MSDTTETQAHELVRRKEWQRAVELYDKVLSAGTTLSKNNSKERIVACLLGRSECCLELGRHEAVVADCRKIIKLLADGNENNNGARARKRLVYALFSLRRFSEAELATREWLLSGNGTQIHPEAVKTLERLRSILQMANGQKGGNVRMLQQKLDEELVALESRFEALTGFGNKENQRKNRKQHSSTEYMDDKKKMHSQIKNNSFLQQNEQKYHSDTNVACSYCRLTFIDRAELRSHCQSESHQTVIMSDEGRDWKWRPPPRGFKADTYTLCESFSDGGSCRYGAQCVEAHGSEELTEWRERFEYRRMRLQRACEKELYGKSYTEQILEKWIQSANPDKVLREKIEGVEDSCSTDLATTVSSKLSKREWIFSIKTRKNLKAVALLQDAHRNHFFLKQVILGTNVNQKKNKNNKPLEVELTSDQEWCTQNLDTLAIENPNNIEHRVKVAFSTDIFGTFRQSVVFDFGGEPVLVKHLCVDVIPVTDADKVKEIRKEIVLSAAERWDTENSNIIPFTSPINPVITSTSAIAGERDLLNLYPAPRADTFTLTHSTIVEKKLTKNNYRSRMHELLCVEEMARYEQVARYNLTTKLRIIQSYLLAPNGIATSTAKYSHSGELFALLTLGKDVSEDTSAGRLILNNCTSILLTSAENSSKNKEEKNARKIYEALIEDKGKNVVYLRLSAITVKELNMKTDTDFPAEVQFQLNRVSYCEWHYAIDKIADFRVIFPDTYLEPSIPWTPQRQWADILDSRLNLKQKEAVVAITTPVAYPLPPILIIGPFGTGKTYTLAQAIKQLLVQPETKILICTHSNSAADLYIKDYLHPYVEAGHEEARPLRIYYHKRWVATVNQVVQKYCLIEMNGGVRNFRVPTLEDIMKHRIIVVTLSISMYLSTMGLPKGHFTHILLDEAAQAMECEAIMPLALANENTRIVLAGDHMQLSPELFSEFAKERNLHVSLLERLYDHYPTTFPCKILLCENYRAHEAIIHFTSELFYDQKLISSGKQPRHEKFYPLTFFTTRGEDVQDQNSTAFYNNSEVYEVVERVCELRKKWPTSWGKMDEQSIGIMTPYADQVFRIRSELRKRRMGGISVERVLNVQGKQFRAIFLSTVRTRRTCMGVKPSGDDMDYGFLSNSKLLNTAITRAQSLVAVVGDPVALCSIGRCRKVWERFIDICNQNKSLFGITWSFLRSQLDGVELKKTYVLNPLAPEFIPRQMQAEAYIKMPVMNFNTSIPPPPIGTNVQQSVANFRHVPSTGGTTTTVATLPTPFVIPPGAPMISLPWYCFPTPQATPQTHLVRSLAPPPPPPNVQQYPPNSTPLNPWTGLNYSLVSPPGGRNTPTNWSTKILPPVKKPTNVLGNLNLNIRTPSMPVPLRSPGGVPFPNNVLKNNANNGFIPLPVSRTGESIDASNPQTILQDGTIVHNNDGAAAAMFSNMQNRLGTGSTTNQQQQNLSQLMAIQQVKFPSEVLQQNFKKPEKEIQFLNNVHFPERNQQMPNRLPTTDISNLLPLNMTLADMLFQPPSQHVEWYRHLIDVSGIDTANRFLELLLQAKKQHEMLVQQANATKSVDEFLTENKAPIYANQQSIQGLQLIPPWPIGDKASELTQHLPMQHTQTQQQHHQNQQSIPNYQTNKPVLLRDIESSLISSNIQNHFEDYREVQQPSTHRVPETIKLPWEQYPVQQSVPLYRRQSQFMQQNQPSNCPNLEQQHNEKQQQAQSLNQQQQHTLISNAFAGYARASMNMHQHQQTSMEQQQSQQQNQQPPRQQPQPQSMQPHPTYYGSNNTIMQQHQMNPMQHQLQRQVNADFANMSLRDGVSMEEIFHRQQQETTYASVLRQSNSAATKSNDEKNGDPFAVLRELGHKATTATNGDYLLTTQTLIGYYLILLLNMKNVFEKHSDLVAVDPMNHQPRDLKRSNEPRLIFMSADSVYHQIELAKKKGKVHDFPAFALAVEGARKKVNDKVLNIDDFRRFVHHSSVKNTNFNHDKSGEVYLANIV